MSFSESVKAAHAIYDAISAGLLNDGSADRRVTAVGIAPIDDVNDTIDVTLDDRSQWVVIVAKKGS